MVPVDELFSRFPRVVRDLADRSGKEIELRIVGQETRLDRTIVERLSDPMIHLIRNAVDHALETPEERLDAGQAADGPDHASSAGHEGDRVAIRVEDDGRGLDREQIVRKGIALGTGPRRARRPTTRGSVSLIFEPGFSTRDKVSELSGRGVGLDVVRDAVRALRGSLAVESTPGKGTAFIFRLPLTLALIDGLLVETAGGRYVVPLAQVEECVALNDLRPGPVRGPALRRGPRRARADGPAPQALPYPAMAEGHFPHDAALPGRPPHRQPSRLGRRLPRARRGGQLQADLHRRHRRGAADLHPDADDLDIPVGRPRRGRRPHPAAARLLQPAPQPGQPPGRQDRWIFRSPVAGTARARVTGLTVWTSLNDGQTWRRAPAHRVGSGRYTARFPRVTPGQAVSLRSRPQMPAAAA